MIGQDGSNLEIAPVSDRGWLGIASLALADVLGPGGQIYSVDRNRAAVERQEQPMRVRFPKTAVIYAVADFTERLDLPPLDGVIMANSLHFLPDKAPTLQLVRSYLRSSGRLLLVEYDTDRGNPWVPYPLSYRTWEKLARRNGFVSTALLRIRPSRFLGQIYSALSVTR